ncbi:tRNA (5-methylaminomethyl-2-thiouridine)(34)-methyltransferase MnmD [Ponticoccus sp. SC2-23]|uniref:tRNA (5-methylaminomethyl-2-thiouridine)(34)-methyltransferase MnmD n=1 Tax=Alexandriicola marinus TaxID=2081710 RepID=UPI000FD90B22|nr:tRNA (5-methylaminomethyl-2-thiouridine)(34)-methyltransferase MnmD [Alexandriicola marinus]MBM1221893.1 tRNA (5-methylaminomethyl-2-thiouridine)(34)-methyltransferase MnmD [Ponticoccus sp. SC6-9]MBM1226244.1 tRNA (5-methylaminomethyl-2-thiouridine)(34)-methyltransferase MnmD [Ponticoccus sp. SC6-15]MBM1230840.1 tRNA (5-methylaminomethyl-2-thiouridine)(34)-methyltransferase MnmD [Ponticoccus sp. SC6-38]MBM1235319.1 tRNA (5-methylaminomethyl-2-thiouridine)(34)-methyltransferase MnmD [Ponticoc
MADQQSDIGWRDGDVPVSERFQDPYFSLENGLEETRYVFLSGNDLPARFAPGFSIAELGFGTGLNFLTTWLAWEKADIDGSLRFTSFEAYPLAPSDMARALSAFPALDDRAARLVDAVAQGGGLVDLGPVILDLVIGDARETVPVWTGQADAWFLDGFAPARNPELWEPALLSQVFGHTRPGGTAATYTAAGAVRRALSEAGFEVWRGPGYGRKRHMTHARRPL